MARGHRAAKTQRIHQYGHADAAPVRCQLPAAAGHGLSGTYWRLLRTILQRQLAYRCAGHFRRIYAVYSIA